MRYVAKKTGVLLVTILLVSFLAFAAFQLIPGDPTTKLLGTEYTPERAAALRHDMGLDRNVFVRYAEWLAGFVTGDLGTSYSYDMPVSQVLAGKPAVTAALSLMAWLMVIVISLPVGIVLAMCRSRWLERVSLAVNQVFMAVPPFFIGILFTYLFGLVLRLFVPGGFVPLEEDFGAGLRYLLFPALAIAIPKAAMVIKLLRSSILRELDKDYIRTAYSRGRSRRGAILFHALRNALLPVVTFTAMMLADIVAGSIIIEQVFALPGLGRMLITGIGNRDYPVAQCIVVIIAFVVVFMNYLADVVSQYIDPRVRLG